MNIKVPSNYRDQFMVADRTFQHQPVYDPLSRRVIPLNKMSDSDLPLLVSNLTPNQAYQLALGNIDPISLEEMDNWDPDAHIVRILVYWFYLNSIIDYWYIFRLLKRMFIKLAIKAFGLKIINYLNLSLLYVLKLSKN